MTQLAFNLAGEDLDDRPYAVRAAEWVAEHPQGFALFEMYALRAAANGRRIGWKTIGGLVRDDPRCERTDGGFKINNSLVAYIGEIVAQRHPEIRPWFETRRREHG